MALALARDFVVGFGEKKARGRPVKWDRLATGYLYVEVRRTEEKLVGRDRAKGSLYAEVAKIPCWAGFISRVEGINQDPDPADVVRKKYLEAKSDLWSEVSWKAYSLHILQDDVAAWDDNVREHLKHLRQHKRN